jgi:hypothetical protein
VLLAGIVTAVEVTYHYSLEGNINPQTSLAGIAFSVTDAAPWLAALALLAAGGASFAWAWREVRRAWDAIALQLQERAG